MSISAIMSGKKPFGIDELGSSFASALAQRLKGPVTAEPSTAGLPPEELRAAQQKSAQLDKLEKALGGTVSYMAEEHGVKAASTMIALVMKRLGDGEINEGTLGEAFLDVARFVDANFGTDKGDNLLEHLNGSLNRSMNDFFDNGLSETFMVAPAGVSAASVAAQSVGGEGSVSISELYAESIKTLLEEARVPIAEQGRKNSPYTLAYEERAMQGALADFMV